MKVLAVLALGVAAFDNLTQGLTWAFASFLAWCVICMWCAYRDERR